MTTSRAASPLRLAELAPGTEAARDRLPDRVIEWGEVSPMDSAGVASGRRGELCQTAFHGLPILGPE